MPRIKACVFDAYGTLFDVAAAARDYAAALPQDDPLAANWAAVAETWRLKQLEYSWLRAADGRYTSFWRVTEDGLDYALEAHGIAAAAHREGLLRLYRRLEAFPEAGAALRDLREAGLPCAILSNGAPEMLAAAVEHAGFDALLDAVMSAEEAGVFKPSPMVYALAAARYACAAEDILFFSANGWDAGSAAAYGFRTVWVNRRGAPVDRLGVAPEAIMRDLTAAAEVAARLAAQDR